MSKSYALQFFTIILLILSCDSSDEGYLKEKIVGNWDNELYVSENPDAQEQKLFIENYNFSNDGEYERITSVYDVNEEFLGFSKIISGTFEVNGNKILFTTSEFFTSNGLDYPETKMELREQNEIGVDPTEKNIFTLEFNESFNIVRLYPECPFYAVCVGPAELTKIDQ